MSALRSLRFAVLLSCATGCLVPGLEVGQRQDAAAGAENAGSGGDGAARGGGGATPFPIGGAAPGYGGSGSAAGTEMGGTKAGEGGTGGDVAGKPHGATGAGGSQEKPVVHCADFPITDKSRWTVTPFHSSLGNGEESDPLYNPGKHLVDGSTKERWASGTPQQAEGQWIDIDFGRTVALSELTFEQGMDLQDYPRGYAISMSNKHTDFSQVPCTRGEGASVSETVVPLGELQVGRYLMIRQTGKALSWWSIAELDVACHD